MSVIRMIFVTVPPDMSARAVENWKAECAPLMIRQPGCRSEKLLRSSDDPGGFISYSEWDSEESIKRYLASADHQEIKRHNRNISGADVSVKHFTPVD
ncbi:antibiotic biosynthesis monooxygenase family protein [Propylenella binzhouense]|uniref:Antibiotic biosynthesis monooxygenase n=1 Tax=Propylenella binzhouense TaxID=2555902 RepID=A0A964WV05_9HYPH|nr:antibiotic biosynthesis monooxygenase family protein [Propylenella binzhouense]MYZ49370.1 antibiotic biosynthesis monooxygenase [Propylenella binzhouense]